MKRPRIREATLVAVLIAGSALSTGCAPRETDASQAAAPSSESSTPDGVFVGKAVETMDAGGYTYVLAKRGDEQVWVAGPETPLKVGDEIRVALEMPMNDFESKSLGRKFDTIYFVGTFDEGSAADAGADPHAGIPGFQTGGAHAVPMKTADATPIDAASIEVPDGGLRIAELWGRRAELTGKEVQVRGRVVKFNANILGRNWMHLQDGTGEAQKGDHDLAVTTDASASVGDVVTVRGKVAVDRDFGAGYSYPVMVEEAVIEAR